MMLEAVFRGRRIDAHTADGIKNIGDGRIVMMMRVAGVVTLSATANRFLGAVISLCGAAAGGMSLVVRFFAGDARHETLPVLKHIPPRGI
jgi:hypothetical protein